MVTATDFEYKKIGAEKIYKPAGCEKCGGTGFFGRIALHEILTVDKKISELILYSRDLEKIHNAALANGLKSLLVDGLEKVRAGLTTFDELQIILGEEVIL